MIKRRRLLASTAGWTIVAASAVRAQSWPSQPVKIVVPYIPSGSTDTAGRLLAEKLTPLLGQQVFVENRGGGNTIIGMELVAKAKPDGHTLLLGTTTLATNAALGLKQPYDPLKDFQPISTVVDIPDFIGLNKDHPAKDLKAFAEWVNRQPERVRFATSGIGNQPHLWGELFKTRNKLNMEFVAYKGAADALRDVMGGHVPMIVDVVMPAGQHAAQGRLTGLVVSSEKRSPVAPDVPTVVELGRPDLVMTTWFGIAMPKGTPAAIVLRVNAEIGRALAEPDVVSRLAAMGVDAAKPAPPASFAAFIVDDVARWRKVVKDAGVTVD